MPQADETINIQVASLAGDAHSFETHPSAKVCDVKAMINERLGHPSTSQKLLLGSTILADSNVELKDVGIADGSLLTLILSGDPLGQSLLAENDGKKTELSKAGTPEEVLNEFQLMSLQAAWKSGGFFSELNEETGLGPWGNLGAWSIDLHWTTRSNGCRYEYWSTAPGDNEVGALVRIDAESITCIGEGSDDGLEVFDDFTDDNVANQLVKEGWPRFGGHPED
jgi:hypothetical protein